MSHSSTVLLPTTVVDTTAFVQLHNTMDTSSDQVSIHSGAPATPHKTSTGTPNTSQSSISPEFSSIGKEDVVVADHTHTNNVQYSISDRIHRSTMASYSTPSRQRPQLLNDATTSTVTTAPGFGPHSVKAKTTLCFPFDLDLVHALGNRHLASKTTVKRNEQLGDISSSTGMMYTIDELQTISREARGHLMELTVSREGRELQRWEHLGMITASGRNGTGDFKGGANSSCMSTDMSLPRQTIDNMYLNCRLTTGCIPILPGGRILLISSSKSQNVFVLPKGGWEHDESLPLSALRETLEEAGVTGLLGPPLPPLTYETKKSVNRRLLLGETQSSTSTIGSTTSDRSDRPVVSSDSPVSAYHTHNRLTIFPMYVQCVYDQWPEMNRLRRIVSIDEATQLLQHRPEFLHMMNALRERNLHLIGDTPTA